MSQLVFLASYGFLTLVQLSIVIGYFRLTKKSKKDNDEFIKNLRIEVVLMTKLATEAEIACEKASLSQKKLETMFPDN